MAWTYRPDDLAAALQAAGFDVDRSVADLSGGGGSLTARRERADRTILVAVDAGGRIRLDVTERLTAASSTAETLIGGVAFRQTDETVRTRTLTGMLVESDDLPRVLDDLIRAPGGRGEVLPEAPANQPPPKPPAPSSGPW